MRGAIRADSKKGPQSASQSSVTIQGSPNASMSGSASASASGNGSSSSESKHSGPRVGKSNLSQPPILEEGSPPTEWAVRPPFVHAVSSEGAENIPSPKEMTPNE